MSLSSIQIANEIKQRPLGLADVVAPKKPIRHKWWLVPVLFAGMWILMVGGSYLMVKDFLG